MALNHTNCDNQLDPEMVIRISMENKTIEALEITQLIGGTTKVYDDLYHSDPNKVGVNLKAKEDLNDFLKMWLTNIIEQGFKLPYFKLEELGYPELEEIE